MEVFRTVKVFQSSVFIHHTSHINTLNKQIFNNLLSFKNVPANYGRTVPVLN